MTFILRSSTRRSRIFFYAKKSFQILSLTWSFRIYLKINVLLPSTQFSSIIYICFSLACSATNDKSWKKIGGFFTLLFLLLNRYFSLSRKEENSTSTKYSQFGVWYIYILTNTLLTHKKSKVFYVDYIKMHEKWRCLCHKFNSEIIFNIFVKALK